MKYTDKNKKVLLASSKSLEEDVRRKEEEFKKVKEMLMGVKEIIPDISLAGQDPKKKKKQLKPVEVPNLLKGQKQQHQIIETSTNLIPKKEKDMNNLNSDLNINKKIFFSKNTNPKLVNKDSYTNINLSNSLSEKNLDLAGETNSEYNSSSTSWRKFDKNLLDDSAFRKQNIKKKKMEIDCDKDNSNLNIKKSNENINIYNTDNEHIENNLHLHNHHRRNSSLGTIMTKEEENNIHQDTYKFEADKFIAMSSANRNVINIENNLASNKYLNKESNDYSNNNFTRKAKNSVNDYSSMAINDIKENLDVSNSYDIYDNNNNNETNISGSPKKNNFNNNQHSKVKLNEFKESEVDSYKEISNNKSNHNSNKKNISNITSNTNYNSKGDTTINSSNTNQIKINLDSNKKLTSQTNNSPIKNKIELNNINNNKILNEKNKSLEVKNNSNNIQKKSDNNIKTTELKLNVNFNRQQIPLAINKKDELIKQNLNKNRDILERNNIISNKNNNNNINNLINKNDNITTKNISIITRDPIPDMKNPYKHSIQSNNKNNIRNINSAKKSVKSIGEIISNNNKTPRKKDILSKSLSSFKFDFEEEDPLNLSSLSTFDNKNIDIFNKIVDDHISLEFHQISDFLESLGLLRHLETFLKFGYEDLDKVIDKISEERLKRMEIPFGHRAKILKRVREFKAHRNKSALNNNDNNSQTNPKNYEHTEMHEMACGIDKKDFNSSVDNDIEKDKDNEIYDEEEQSRLFRLAVQEFRSGKIEEKKNIPPKSGNKNNKITIIREVDEEVNENDELINENPEYQGKFDLGTSTQDNDIIKKKFNLTNSSIKNKYDSNEKEKENEKKFKGKNFLFNVGESSFLNFDNLAQFSSLSSSTIDPEIDTNFLPLNKKKESCFNCFKLIIIEEGNNYEFFGKNFCGENCKKTFEYKNLIECSLKDCRKLFEKNKAIFENKCYFCCIKCFSQYCKDNGIDITKILSNSDINKIEENKINQLPEEKEEIDYDAFNDF